MSGDRLADRAQGDVGPQGDGLPEIPGIRLSVASVTSSRDGSEQPVIVGIPDGHDAADTPLPLLVGLHTWSADYRQQALAYGTHAARSTRRATSWTHARG
jgi:hypothetical protein